VTSPAQDQGATPTPSASIYALARGLQGMLLCNIRIGWGARLVLIVAALALIVPNLFYSLAGLLAIILVYVVSVSIKSRGRKDGGSE
jgi:TRAP-type uncharacterized transport system fused permease subunit